MKAPRSSRNDRDETTDGLKAGKVVETLQKVLTTFAIEMLAGDL